MSAKATAENAERAKIERRVFIGWEEIIKSVGQKANNIFQIIEAGVITTLHLFVQRELTNDSPLRFMQAQ